MTVIDIASSINTVSLALATGTILIESSTLTESLIILPRLAPNASSTSMVSKIPMKTLLAKIESLTVAVSFGGGCATKDIRSLI